MYDIYFIECLVNKHNILLYWIDDRFILRNEPLHNVIDTIIISENTGNIFVNIYFS